MMFESRSPSPAYREATRLVLVVLVPMWLCGCRTDVGAADASQGWLYHGGDAGSTKYSSLTQINTDNVSELEIAWRWTSPDNELLLDHPKLFPPFLHEVTPVVDDGVMYVSTSYQLVVAIEAATGRTLWTYDPGTWQRNALRSEQSSRYEGAPPNWGFLHRGVSYWREEGFRRVYHGTGDGFLISLDADTGRPDPSFGDGGIVDLTVGLSRPVERAPDEKLASMNYGVNSPPIVCGGALVVGSSITDGVSRTNRAPGDVRGFDLRTGQQLWRFNTVPRGSEYGTETWEDDSWREAGSANVWTPMSCDPELGYVYLPVGAATNDHYGGHRPGDNLFSQSIVAVDAHTGERVWHFQTVHHGVWDYDPVAAPVLGDIVVDGRTVRAVMQTTKQGFVFVFDRRTGEPVWPIEERSVPTDGAAPGEWLSPTQPFPTVPSPFDRQGVSVDDLIDFTPELRSEALEIIEPYRIGPLFTPPTTQRTLTIPSRTGGGNWNGAAFDPETGILYVPSQTKVDVYQVVPGDSLSGARYMRGGERAYRSGPRGLPLTKPPYGRVTAIGLNDGGEHLWVKPIGDGPIDHPALRDLDLPPLGYPRFRFPIVTAGGLLFLSEGRSSGLESAWRTLDRAPDQDYLEPSVFRALDKADGTLLWEYELPGPASALPMTFSQDGVQYVVVAVGGFGTWPEELIAFHLPEAGR